MFGPCTKLGSGPSPCTHLLTAPPANTCVGIRCLAARRFVVQPIKFSPSCLDVDQLLSCPPEAPPSSAQHHHKQLHQHNHQQHQQHLVFAYSSPALHSQLGAFLQHGVDSSSSAVLQLMQQLYGFLQHVLATAAQAMGVCSQPASVVLTSTASNQPTHSEQQQQEQQQGVAEQQGQRRRRHKSEVRNGGQPQQEVQQQVNLSSLAEQQGNLPSAASTVSHQRSAIALQGIHHAFAHTPVSTALFSSRLLPFYLLRPLQE